MLLLLHGFRRHSDGNCISRLVGQLVCQLLRCRRRPHLSAVCAARAVSVAAALNSRQQNIAELRFAARSVRRAFIDFSTQITLFALSIRSARTIAARSFGVPAAPMAMSMSNLVCMVFVCTRAAFPQQSAALQR